MKRVVARQSVVALAAILLAAVAYPIIKRATCKEPVAQTLIQEKIE